MWQGVSIGLTILVIIRLEINIIGRELPYQNHTTELLQCRLECEIGICQPWSFVADNILVKYASLAYYVAANALG